MNLIFDIYYTLPEIYLILCIFFILIFGVLLSTSNYLGYPLIYKVVSWLSVQSLIFTFILVNTFPYIKFTSWNFLFEFNYFIWLLKNVILVFSILWIYLAVLYIKEKKLNSFEYWILILFAIVALLFMLQVNDLLTLYLIIEFQSLTFYVLASFKRFSEFSTEAGLKYFVVGAFSSAFLLFGLSIIYGLTGLSNFKDLSLFFSGVLIEDIFFFLGILLGLIFITVALFFKLSVVPFHMWSPDVYEGAPLSTTSFFIIFSKIGPLILLLKLFFNVFLEFSFFWNFFFITCAFFSLLVGSLGALLQKKWKRFIAYSAINNIGFILIGFISGEVFGIISIFMYVFIYIITSFGIFSLLVGFKIYKYPEIQQMRYLKNILSMSKLNPIISASITLLFFSMAGIPPLSGFFAKIFIFIVGIKNNAYGLIFFAIIISSIACFYYIRLIQLLNFFKKKKLPINYLINKEISIILGMSVLFTLLFFLDIELFYLPLKRMALIFIV